MLMLQLHVVHKGYINVLFCFFLDGHAGSWRKKYAIDAQNVGQITQTKLSVWLGSHKTRSFKHVFLIFLFFS